jgi:hypothetical protein
LIEELFTKGNRTETKRNKARKNLILEYPNDPMMITRLLEKASEDKNFENEPSLWQMLYILDNLPIQSLYVKKRNYFFFKKGSQKICGAIVRKRPFGALKVNGTNTVD